MLPGYHPYQVIRAFRLDDKLRDICANPNPNPNQVIRAFRLDDELRDMMLPLLDVPADKF